jgi:hypothetical protein
MGEACVHEQNPIPFYWYLISGIVSDKDPLKLTVLAPKDLSKGLVT